MTPSRAIIQMVTAELRRHIRSRWLAFAFALITVLGWGTVQLGLRDYDEQRGAYADALQNRIQVQLRTQWALGRAEEPGLRAIRPPSLGAVFVQGQDRWLPAAWEFTPAGVDELDPYSALGRRLEGGGGWDLDMLTRVVGALIALGLGLSVMLQDQTSGWTRAVRGLPISGRRVNIARHLGGCLTLSALVLTWWTVMSIALKVSGPPEGAIGRLWILAPVAAVQLWIFFGFGVALAASFRSGFRAIAVAIAVWLCGASLGPSLAMLVGELIVPTPSRLQMERERRELFADEMRVVERAVADQLASHLPAVALGELGDAADRAFPKVEPIWQQRILQVRAKVHELEADWGAQRERQRAFIARLNFLLPGALGRDSFSELAGTGRRHAALWEQSVVRYQLLLNQTLFDNRPGVNLRLAIGSGEYPVVLPRYPPPRFRDLASFPSLEVEWQTRLTNFSTSGAGLALWLMFSVGACLWLVARD